MSRVSMYSGVAGEQAVMPRSLSRGKIRAPEGWKFSRLCEAASFRRNIASSVCSGPLRDAPAAHHCFRLPTFERPTISEACTWVQ